MVVVGVTFGAVLIVGAVYACVSTALNEKPKRSGRRARGDGGGAPRGGSVDEIDVIDWAAR